MRQTQVSSTNKHDGPAFHRRHQRFQFSACHIDVQRFPMQVLWTRILLESIEISIAFMRSWLERINRGVKKLYVAAEQGSSKGSGIYSRRERESCKTATRPSLWSVLSTHTSNPNAYPTTKGFACKPSSSLNDPKLARNYPSKYIFRAIPSWRLHGGKATS